MLSLTSSVDNTHEISVECRQLTMTFIMRERICVAAGFYHREERHIKRWRRGKARFSRNFSEWNEAASQPDNEFDRTVQMLLRQVVFA